MDDKIFLGKYRISAEEIHPAGELTCNSLAYQAEAIDSGKKVVVELVSTGSLKMAAIKRLKAQAIAAKKLNHVNIPHLYDFGVEGDYIIYVTEDLAGTLAEEWVSAHGPIPVGAVLRIASQVMSALSAAAFRHIVHPAINPRNLLLVPGQTAEGEWPLVKVLHFVGIASNVSGTDTAVAAFDKSLHYVSPEQIKKGMVDFRSEIYSLGCTMWFLLTGAPPLAGKKGPMATKVAGKASDIPKKVRRLLAQMLSTNPEARLRDPLEFYRKLQECLVQAERRERMSRRFGVPSLVHHPATGLPFFRRTPSKALAVAAVLLMIATLAAFVVPRSIRHRRIVRAQEPIGVPIGVPDAVVIATPAALSVAIATPPASPMASNPSQETGTLAQSNSSPPGPVAAVSDRRPVSVLAVDGQRLPLQENQKQANEVTEATAATNTKALSPATDSLESAAQNQVNKAPQPTTPDLSPNLQGQEPAPITADNANGKPTTSPSETTSASRVATAQPPLHSRDTMVRKTAPKTIVMHEVRRAEPAEAEVRRAEPAPPAEGPEAPALATSHRPARPNRRFGERIYTPKPMPGFAEPRPLPPRKSVRARFVGVTSDGRWIMQLPSNEIVIVPPPPGRDR